MTVNKRKKNSRQKGSHTYGWGSKKKHRGSGNRGGFGMAGTGKRADQKKSWILRNYGTDYFGKRGFNLPSAVKQETRIINIQDLPAKNEIDLTGLGYTKLLSKGRITHPVKVTVASCSAKAKAKIEKAGGQVLTRAA
ncbi:MAG TPA: uL15 family ribosomal protein [Candidatus Nanoarchaeia archaeon]|nr:uL15 family ribosomal protein [Candidatus Nanoarchaeia archaeon]